MAEPRRACPACGDASHAPRAAFCLVCGAALPTPAVPAMPATAAEPPPLPVAPAPPVADAAAGSASPAAPPASSRAAVVGAICAVVAASAVAFGVAALQPGEAHVVVGERATAQWDVVAQQGEVWLPVRGAGIWLPAGPCTIRATPRGDQSVDPEIVRLTLDEDATHVVLLGAVGGAGVTAQSGEFKSTLRERLTPTTPLRACAGCRAFTWRMTCVQCGRATQRAAPGTEVSIDDDPKDFELATEQGVVVVNPYAADVECTVTIGAIESRFLLRASSARAVACAAGASVNVRAVLEPSGEVVSDRVETAPRGVAVCTIGGATLYEWETGGKPAGRVPPSYLEPVGTSPGARISVPASAGGESHPLLVASFAEGGDVRDASLFAVASASLVAPATAPLGEIVANPRVSVNELAVPKSFAGRTITSVACDGRTIVAVCDGEVFDYATGEQLCGGDVAVASAAMSPSGLFLLTRDARTAAIRDRVLVPGVGVEDPTLSAWAHPGGGVILFGGSATGGMFRLDPGGAVTPVLGAGHFVAAVTEGPEGLVVAEGRRIGLVAAAAPPPAVDAGAQGGEEAGDTGGEDGTDTMEGSTPAEPPPDVAPIVVLPSGPPVIGLLARGGVLLFATEDEVGVVSGDLVLPLVTGIGGPLFAYGDGVLVHDRRSRKLLVLSGPALKGR